jgi:hypothetical protein
VIVGISPVLPSVMGQTVEAQRKKSGTAAKPSERGEAYRAFFQRLIDELRERGFTNARLGQPQNWYTFASGLQGIGYGATFAQGGQARAEVNIDRGDAPSNKALFDELSSARESAEQDFGEALSWERLDGKKACRVAVYRPGSIEDGPQTLEIVRTWMVEHLLRLRDVFGWRLAELLGDGQR